MGLLAEPIKGTAQKLALPERGCAAEGKTKEFQQHQHLQIPCKH